MAPRVFPAAALVLMLAALIQASLTTGARGHGPADRSSSAIDDKAALAVSQKALGREVRSVVLTDTAGRTVDLADLHGKPVIVSMIYTSCYHTCPLIAQSLRNAVEVGRRALGSNAFEVAMVGFDVAFDTPDHMAAFAHNQGIDPTAWRLLSGDQGAIDQLAADLGFIYARSPRGFDHLAQVTILDRQGRVFKQVYGDDFRAPAIVEPLKRLALNRRVDLAEPTTLLDRIKLICTVYDPTQDRYRFSYAIFIGMLVGAVSLLSVAVFVVRAWRRSRFA
jgi:protein SCO1/2